MRVIATILACAALAAAGPAESYKRVGRSHSNVRVEFGVSMPQTNLDKLEKIFWDVSTPGNPEYGKFRTFEELNDLTATPEDVRSEVAAWMSKSGAKCEAPTKDSLACSASVGTIESMLSTNMYKYQHKETGVAVHRIGTTYQFPKEMKGKINFITGLKQFPVPHYGQVNPGSGARRALEKGSTVPEGSSLSVVPETLTSVYNIDTPGSQKVVQSAIEFQGLGAFENSDMSTFFSNTGETSFKINDPIGPFEQFSPQAESTLDVQYLGSVGMGNYNTYWTSNNWMYDWSNAVLSGKNSVPDVMSMSYGWSETEQCEISPDAPPCQSGGSQAFVEAVNTNFQKIGAAGHTLLAASGDSGAHGRTDTACSSGEVHPAFPAASPYLTAVGATQLMADAASTGASEPICQSQLQCATSGSEQVCSTESGALITSGGGFSNYAARPSYQDSVVTAYLAMSGVTPPDSDFNKAGRGFPDVAALGHSYYIELQGQVADVDGTSCSCPVFGGVLGLLNAYRVENGKSKLGFANPFLYQLYASAPKAFTDITIGNNKCTELMCCSTGFEAATGWDATTGLGTPNVAEMIKGMAAMDSLSSPSSELLGRVADMLRGTHYKH